MLHSKGVWVQGNGENEGTLGQTVLSAGVKAQASAQTADNANLLCVPLTAGVEAPSPGFHQWGP